MSSETVCFVCTNKSEEECVDCNIQFCNNHKYFHKDEETGVCYPYTVEFVDGVGRIIRANRDIQPGEAIFREREMVVGPCRSSKPMCLGCCGKVDGTVLCSCSWPICTADCPQLYRHTKEECDIISIEDGSLRDNEHYYGILPLRVLLLPDDKLQYFLQFMDHGEEREDNFQDLVDLVRTRWKQAQFSEELIRRVEGVLDVNTVEHRVIGSESARGFLPITSLASHSCASNSIKDKSDSTWVTTRARIIIKKGEEVTFHYTGGLKGRFMRRPALREGWFFWCTCPRCSSPSELGSEISSLRCTKNNCQGTIRPVKPLQMNSVYRCEECSSEISALEAETKEKELTAKLENCYRNDTVALEQLLAESTDFHINHFLILIIKWLLITSWGREKGLENVVLPEETLERKVVFCRQYLSALDVLDPGLSHNRGLTLWELYSAHTFLINKRFQEERLSPVKFLDGLKESLDMVNQAAWCLQFNPENTSEYKVRQLATTAQENLKKTIQFFSTVLPVPSQ